MHMMTVKDNINLVPSEHQNFIPASPTSHQRHRQLWHDIKWHDTRYNITSYYIAPHYITWLTSLTITHHHIALIASHHSSHPLVITCHRTMITVALPGVAISAMTSLIGTSLSTMASKCGAGITIPSITHKLTAWWWAQCQLWCQMLQIRLCWHAKQKMIMSVALEILSGNGRSCWWWQW